MPVKIMESKNMDQSDKIEFLWKVLDREEAQIRATDQKLSFLLVVITATLSGAVAIMSSKFAEPLRVHHAVLFGLLLTLILLSGGVSLLLVLAVLIPRTWRIRSGQVKETSLLFFSDIHRMPTNAYYHEIATLDHEQIVRDLSRQIESLSDIAIRKILYVKWLTFSAGLEIIGLIGILGLLAASI